MSKAAAGGAGAGTATPGAGNAGVNVQVAVRCRPFNKRERGLNAASVIEVPDGRVTTLRDPMDGGRGKKDYTFTFDHSYWWE
jgi:hypothetical protein